MSSGSEKGNPCRSSQTALRTSPAAIQASGRRKLPSAARAAKQIGVSRIWRSSRPAIVISDAPVKE
jgi:hypothetical protein